MRRTLFCLVVLRYRLQWAYARGSPLRSIKFAAGRILMVILIPSAGVTGIAIITLAHVGETSAAAVRTVFSVLFLSMLAGSFVFGYGVDRAFSDSSLRHYPLSRRARLLIRIGLGLLEPLWVFAFATFFGCALVAWLYDAGPFWMQFSAAFLVVLAGFLLTKVMLSVVNRMLASGIGTVVLAVTVQVALLIPALAVTLFANTTPEIFQASVLEVTPPALAADLMLGNDVPRRLLWLGGWCAVLGMAVLFLEGAALKMKTHSGRKAVRSRIYDGIGDAVPLGVAPLVSRALRLYLRNLRTRVNLLVVLPIIAVIVGQRAASSPDSLVAFEVALFAGGCLGLATAPIDMNMFGFDGPGFKRLLLTPATARDHIWSMAAATGMVGGAYIFLGLLVWLIAAPVATSFTMLAIMTGYAVSALLVFHAIGIWCSVLAPYRGNYEEKWRRGRRKDIAFLAAMGIVFVPVAMRMNWPEAALISHGAFFLVGLVAALVLYVQTLRVAPRILERRSESILHSVEGRT